MRPRESGRPGGDAATLSPVFSVQPRATQPLKPQTNSPRSVWQQLVNAGCSPRRRWQIARNASRHLTIIQAPSCASHITAEIEPPKPTPSPESIQLGQRAVLGPARTSPTSAIILRRLSVRVGPEWAGPSGLVVGDAYASAGGPRMIYRCGSTRHAGRTVRRIIGGAS
jgi:hypothetical protein